MADTSKMTEPEAIRAMIQAAKDAGASFRSTYALDLLNEHEPGAALTAYRRMLGWYKVLAGTGGDRKKNFTGTKTGG
jgi:hypothetical protein